MIFTELMEQILKTDESKKMVEQISQIYGNAYTFLHLLNSQGAELERAKKLVAEFKKQTIPQTATWGLYLWEKELDILPEQGMSTEQRRIAVVNKLLGSGAMNPKRLQNIVEGLTGVEAEVRENTAKNTFEIWLTANPSMVDEHRIRQTVDKAKPARLIYKIKYQRLVDLGVYTIGHIVSTKTIQLAQKG